MSVIGSKKLSAALAKAKNVGLVEETFVVDGTEITLRNLRPDEYHAVLLACQELDQIAYLRTYQVEQIARSIVGINGVDLHDVDFVEEEAPDPKDPTKTRLLKVELSAYLVKNVINSWPKEAVHTVYLKFVDVVKLAEKKAKEGVTFLTPDETEEEKYRRLLLEAKEIEEDLPGTLVDHILGEMGMMKKSTAEELKAAMALTDQLAREREAPTDPAPAPEPTLQETPVSCSVVVPEEKQAIERPTVARPADPHQTLQQAIAARKQNQPAPPQVVPQAQVDPEEAQAAKARADKIAALEADAGVLGVNSLVSSIAGPNGEPIPVFRINEEATELRQQQGKVDAAKLSIDTPPTSGINPRFRPPPKL